LIRSILMLGVLIFASTGGEIAITLGMKTIGEPRGFVQKSSRFFSSALCATDGFGLAFR